MSTTNQDRFLCFTLGIEEYAIPLLTVREVIAMPEVTPVPNTPPHFLGIMNLRGQVISIMDLRQKLGIKSSPGSETAVIICEFNPVCIGVVVDSINSVVNPKPSEIAETPSINSQVKMDYITGVYQKDHHLLIFLNIAKVLNVEDYSALKNNVKAAAAA